MYFKKKFIVINENTKESRIEAIFIFVKKISLEKTIFFNPKKDTAPKMGIDNKNDIFAESILLQFKSLAAVIAIPDLLTPGTRDNI